MRAVVDAAASLLLGAACPCCGTPSAGACGSCRALLAAPSGPVVVGGAGPPIRAAAEYGGEWSTALVAYKERSAWHLAGQLGAALAFAVAAVLAVSGRPPGRVLLAPVPSRPAVVRTRGRDTTRLLAVQAAGVLRASGVDCAVAPLLRHARRVADQAGLDIAARAANLSGAFAARPPPSGTAAFGAASAVPCIVVDDLTTTGATLREGVRALTAAGHVPLGCAVVAAAARRRA